MAWNIKTLIMVDFNYFLTLENMRYYYMLWFLIFSFLVPLTAISQTNVPAAIAAATITPAAILRVPSATRL